MRKTGCVLFVLLFVLAPLGGALQAASLLAHYEFENNVADTSGNGFDGRIVGDPVFVDGIVGKGLMLDPSEGKKDYVVIDGLNDPNLAMYTDNFSVSVWVNTSGWQDDSAIISNKDWNSGGNTGWVVAGQPGGNGSWQWNFTGDTGGRVDYDPSGPILSDGKWHNLCVTHDRQGLASFYFDGVLQSQIDISSSTGTLYSGYPVVIGTDGAEGAVWAYWFKGIIDDVRIYDGVLSADDVASLVSGVNLPPTVDAGKNQLVRKSSGSAATAQLHGFVDDDGLPSDPGEVSVTWSQLSGPTAEIANPDSLDTTVTMPQLGDYVFMLTASDGDKESTDTITVQVKSEDYTGLVAEYQFEDNVLDVSGNGLDGRIVGNPSYVDGAFGKGLQLDPDDGSHDYVVIDGSQDPNMSIYTGNFTVSVWVKTDGWQNDASIISNKDWNSGGNTGWVIAGQAGGSGSWQWNFTGDTGGRVDYDPSGPTLSDGQWHHLCVTHDRTGVASFYFDGVWQADRNIAPSTGTLYAGYPIVIGTDGAEGAIWAVWFKGIIDDVRIYELALSADEVAALTEAFNFAPVVDAGGSRVAQIGADGQVALKLKGSVYDDGLPVVPGKVTSTWSQLSGPATVQFADTSDPTTSATFTQAGDYELLLTATDGSLDANDVLIVQIFPEGYTGLTGDWRFDDPNKVKATVGTNLQIVGDGITDAAGVDETDGAVLVDVGSYFVCEHGIAPNGGGTLVNEWTILIDFNYESAGWKAFYQVDVTNSNDGECFINPSGHIGVGATGYAGPIVAPGTWYRLVVSVDNGNHYRYYINGVLIQDGNTQAIDGRFALTNKILLFADENGEDAPIRVSRVAMWERALSAEEIQNLGYAGNPSLDPFAGSVAGDLDGSKVVDMGDLVEFSSLWLTNNSAAGAMTIGDFDQDYKVNMNDFAIMAGNWLQGAGE